MSTDGFADIQIDFDPGLLMEKLGNDKGISNVDWGSVISDNADEKDNQLARDVFEEFICDFTDVDYDYSTLNTSDDSLDILRYGFLSSYAEIKSDLFESELKKFFEKYNDVIDYVDVTEELQIDGLWLYKIVNRKEDGKHFLVHSAATVTYQDFTVL